MKVIHKSEVTIVTTFYVTNLNLELEEIGDPTRGMTALGEDSIQRERPSCLVARRNFSRVGGVGVESHSSVLHSVLRLAYELALPLVGLFYVTMLRHWLLANRNSLPFAWKMKGVWFIAVNLLSLTLMEIIKTELISNKNRIISGDITPPPLFENVGRCAGFFLETSIFLQLLI